ncbi:MAG: SDR family NAD(P)-dependent oxidoreductase [Clostridia bacterium]|nr:SDR family NAD(P)-dependent oxidoreductase [Clostridia bacterium]
MRILITGANRGLGLSLTELFVQKGHFVLAGVRSLKNMGKLSEIQQTYAEHIETVEMDVNDDESVARASERISKRYSSIDGIINNAAILLSKHKRIDELDVSEIKLTMETNVYGPYRVIKSFLPLLYHGQGQCIINISSESGSISTCGTQYCSYSMSKSALNLMNQMFSNLLEEKGIRVLAVHPGRMNTDMGAETAQIEPIEAAQGIYDIVTGKIGVQAKIKFIDYHGNPMPL